MWYHRLLSIQTREHFSNAWEEEQGARTRRVTHRQMGEVSAEDTRDIMRRVILLFPIKRLAILDVSSTIVRRTERKGIRTRGGVSNIA